MPHHEEAPADDIESLAFVLCKVGILTRDRSGNDGMVVAYLAVVYNLLLKERTPGPGASCCL
jgi:hypothetical protein